MASASPFKPYDAASVKITVSATTQRVLVANSGGSVRIVNLGTATVWIRAGGSTVEATTSNLAILAGSETILDLGDAGPLYIAAIAAGATGDIQFTPGIGL